VQAFRHWITWADPPVESHLLPGGAHGSDLLVPITDDDDRALGIFRRAVLGFLARYAS
jgi:hypothetical protein